MKKSTIALIVVILGIGLYFAWDGRAYLSSLAAFFGGERKLVEDISLSFMEDLKFKDFAKAASYHHPEIRKKVNIPKLIEKMFRIKPELLDIINYDIIDSAIDASGKRARVKVKAKVHILNTDKIKDPELILYFHKKEGQWYMELQSSLK